MAGDIEAHPGLPTPTPLSDYDRTGDVARSRHFGDLLFQSLTSLGAVILVAVVASILALLIWKSLPAMQRFGVGFIASSDWDPLHDRYGAWPSIYGTLVTTAIAMSVAVPLALVTALFLVDLSPPWLSRIVGTGLELLAAVPSIIYGMWGMTVFASFMQRWVEPALANTLGFLPLFQGSFNGMGMLTAGLILALMVLPYICAVSRDVFRMTPGVLKESAYGMGATTWEVTRDVTIPYGMRGILGAVFLGLARAIGETMAVTFVIGDNRNVATSLFASGNTISSTLANQFNEAAGLKYSVLVELGLVLFMITVAFEIAAHLWLRRLRNAGGR
ncbi:MAG TPA: phosphate ABC transporter permease subunit PstC [Pirellulales bacterium]|nr:phosphate ABC transporter permease subunit PstC [Pirellulales bacterium]